jgi:phage-related protein (TIGR01555 family)
MKEKLYQKMRDEGLRSDSVYSAVTGKGIAGRDKLTEIRPSTMTWGEIDLLQWYLSVKFISRPVDIASEEMYREGFLVKTGDEKLDEAIMERLESLNAYNQFIELEKQTRIYRRGSVLFLCCESENEVETLDLSKPLRTVRKIQSINIIPGYELSIDQGQTDPTKAFYNVPRIKIRGANDIHESRYHWSVNNYNNKFLSGVSLVEQLIEIGSALDIGVWSLANMLYESSIKIVKSDSIKDSGVSIIEAVRNKIKSVLNSQSVLILGQEETFEKQNLTTSGINEIMSFLWEVEGFIGEYGVNVLKGQNKRVISIDKDPELVSMYSKIEHSQEKATAYVKKVIDCILMEMRRPETKYEIEWEKLYILDDNTQADIDLKKAQADQIYQSIGVKNQEDIQKERFPEVYEATNNFLNETGESI